MEGEKTAKPTQPVFTAPAHNGLASGSAGAGSACWSRYRRSRAVAGVPEHCRVLGDVLWVVPWQFQQQKQLFPLTQTMPKQNLLFFLLSPLLTPPLRSDGHRGDVAAGCRGWTWAMLLATMCYHGAELGAQQMLSIWPFLVQQFDV